MSSLQATNVTAVRRGEPLRVNPSNLAEEISVLSWNVLADRHLQGQYAKQNPDCMHVTSDMLVWSNRSALLIDEMISSGADIICLQECEENAFENDFQPQLAKAGYEGLMQEQKASGDGTKFDIGVATFWRRDKLKLTGECHRSRTMVTVFDCLIASSESPASSTTQESAEEGSIATTANSGNEMPSSLGIGVINCHLQGRPDLTTTRVKQLQNSLKELKARFSHHAVLVVGDFNCSLQDSACSGYLAFGAVPQHQTEWGEPVPLDACSVPAHEYREARLTAVESLRGDDFTFCTLPHRTANGLDQIWYSACSLELVGMRTHFASDSDRNTILNITGMPSRINPSDHVPIASVFKWQRNTQITESNSGTNSRSGHDGGCFIDFHVSTSNNASSHPHSSNSQAESLLSKEEQIEEILNEAMSLLMACPISEEERIEFESTLLPYEPTASATVEPPTPGSSTTISSTNNSSTLKRNGKGKPSQVEIDYYQQQRQKKELLLSNMSEEANQMLDAVMKLRRKAEKIKQQKK